MSSRCPSARSFATRALLLAALTAAFVAGSVSTSLAQPVSQQPPPAGGPPAGPGGGGGGANRRQPDPIDFNNHDGWNEIYDGKTLTNWKGNPEVWSVIDGNITANSTEENPTGTTYLHWTGGRPKDFELKLELRLENNGNVGVQYRSELTPPNPGRGGGAGGPGGPGGPGGGARRGNPNNGPYNLGGYQFDFNFDGRYPGQLYENGRNAAYPEAPLRGIITYRGQVVEMVKDKAPRIVASVGDPDQLKGYMNINGWNQVHIIAHGPVLIHILNGHVMSVSLDRDPTLFKDGGLISVQIEGVGRVSYKNIWLKEYK